MKLALGIVYPPKHLPTDKVSNGQTIVGAGGPPIDDLVCVVKPPASGHYHMNAVDGVVTGVWVLD